MTLIRPKFTLRAFQKLSKASGENEAEFVPSFYRFFYDEENFADTVVQADTFFVLGRKGTGKSLLAHYVTHKWSQGRESYRRFVEVQSFRNFAFQNLSPFKQNSLHNKEYFSIWVWALCLAIAKQRIADVTIPPSESLVTLKRLLDEQLPKSKSAKELIEQTSSLKLSGGLKDIFSVEGQLQKKERPAESFGVFLEIEQLVLDALSGTTSESIIFLDDLDDGFEDTELYEQSLASLIYATDHVNRLMHRSGLSAKIVLLLRTDIFHTINTSDLNRFRTDNAVVLDWNIEDKENSPLIRLLVHRLTTALGEKLEPAQYAEAFYELFEDSVETRRTASWMLDLTLGRPRDLVQLTKLACTACPSHSRFTAYSLS